jgi:hypothetical protein
MLHLGTGVISVTFEVLTKITMVFSDRTNYSSL